MERWQTAHSNSLRVVCETSRGQASVYWPFTAKERLFLRTGARNSSPTVLLQVPPRWPRANLPPAPHRALPLEGPTPASEPSCVERAFLIGALSQGRRRPSRPCAPRPASPAPPARSYPEARSCRGARQGKPGSVRDLGPALPRTREAAAPGTGAGMEGGAWLGLGARPAGLWVWVGGREAGRQGRREGRAPYGSRWSREAPGI